MRTVVNYSFKLILLLSIFLLTVAPLYAQRVAVIDGAANVNHPAFKDNIVHVENFCNAELNSFNQTHGSFVLGIVDTFQVEIAYVCILNAVDSRKSLNMAMKWLKDNHTKYNINVVNMSFGYWVLGDPEDSYPEETKIIRELTNEGVTFVAATGNDGGEVLAWPAGVDPVIRVGGLDGNKIWASSTKFPNNKDSLQVFYQALWYDMPNAWSRGNGKGTSLSSAAVSGIIANLYKKNIVGNYNEVERWLKQNTVRVDGYPALFEHIPTTIVDDYYVDIQISHVYPTVANEMIRCVDCNRYAIYDIVGRKILESNTETLDISMLSNGVYFIKTENSILKFIKK